MGRASLFYVLRVELCTHVSAPRYFMVVIQIWAQLRQFCPMYFCPARGERASLEGSPSLLLLQSQ
jgi:hypothetical protein